MTNHSQLNNILHWYYNPAASAIPVAYCETRDVFEGRLSKLAEKAQKESNFSCDESFLLTAVVGEIGNNCFDHNLGHWVNEPGLHFMAFSETNSISVIIADRGRGVFKSLSSAFSEIIDPQMALESAFEKKISGRYPERRGNGLKFVRQAINGDKKRGICCQSNGASIIYGKLGHIAQSRCNTSDKRLKDQGTVTFIIWSKDAH